MQRRETILFVASYYDNLISILQDKSPSKNDVLTNIVRAYCFLKTLQSNELRLKKKKGNCMNKSTIIVGQFKSCFKGIKVSDLMNLLLRTAIEGSVTTEMMGLLVDTSNLYLSYSKENDDVNVRAVMNDDGDYTYSKEDPITNDITPKMNENFSYDLLKELKKNVKNRVILSK